MANLTIYKVEAYNQSYYKIFKGVYNDFKSNAVNDYNFELEPLDYDNFVKSVEQNLLNCLILFEDEIPTGFLVYTTLISESIELNIIHCLGTDNINNKRLLLLKKFMEINENLMRKKIVTFPLLGKQNSFLNDLTNLGFKSVTTSVMTYSINNINSINKLKNETSVKLPDEYYITDWKTLYQKEASLIVHQSFKDSYDALFDSRFKTEKGCKDIVDKIINNIYGKFLPDVTKVLVYRKRPVGILFANLTNEKIANIPIAAILKKHRNLGFGKVMLKELVNTLLSDTINNGLGIKEINVSCDSDNLSAINMYKSMGFIEEYSYPLAYKPCC